jgi:hypothetical protein
MQTEAGHGGRRVFAGLMSCDLVVVLLGKYTHKAPGVRTEVQLAKKLGVPSTQLRCIGDSVSRSVLGGGRVVTWTWSNLERELS